jgi:hypothetical protein
MGETALITGRGKQEELHTTGSLTDFVRNHVADQSEQYEGKVKFPLLLICCFPLRELRAQELSRISLSWCHKRKTGPNLSAPLTVSGFYNANSLSICSVTLVSTTVHTLESNRIRLAAGQSSVSWFPNLRSPWGQRILLFKDTTNNS